jgi:hypothetical protein
MFLNFISSRWTLIAHPCERVPIIRTRLVATRLRNIWKKFKNWLYYSPEKRYLRGK